ncbi:complement component C8 gamma chain isoform X3 [Hippopotamus amphibius kiboko]|uniref:complement component C8 gamma chain isoform X3 n=1 Tax=Hippopotamus amphibius kiboko TaxID=575201 RepID=UPI002592FF4C|nr:complement component C8 gamma chain isoform X3 [Hippopotamus amphibius kiboko]
MAVEGRAQHPALAVTAPAPLAPRPGRCFFARLGVLGLSRSSAPGGREGRRPCAGARGRGCALGPASGPSQCPAGVVLRGDESGSHFKELLAVQGRWMCRGMRPSHGGNHVGLRARSQRSIRTLYTGSGDRALPGSAGSSPVTVAAVAMLTPRTALLLTLLLAVSSLGQRARRPPRPPSPISTIQPKASFSAQQFAGTWFLVAVASSCRSLQEQGHRAEATTLHVTPQGAAMAVSTFRKLDGICWQVRQLYRDTRLPGRFLLQARSLPVSDSFLSVFEQRVQGANLTEDHILFFPKYGFCEAADQFHILDGEGQHPAERGGGGAGAPRLPPG